MRLSKTLFSLAIFGLAVNAAASASPCDFKGLSVGDKATPPQQIMKHFGVEKYKDSDLELQKVQAAPGYWEHIAKVGITNMSEETQLRMGPSCGDKSCEIPYGTGVTVGSGAFPISVGVFVSFDKTGIIETIDVFYDMTVWNEVLALMNTKYGDNWHVEKSEQVTMDYETKKTEPQTVINLTHRTPGRNVKTGDTCTIGVSSRDVIFLHTTPPIYRAVMEIKLVSKNF
jgi:hypothetical protein